MLYSKISTIFVVVDGTYIILQVPYVRPSFCLFICFYDSFCPFSCFKIAHTHGQLVIIYCADNILA